MDTYADMIFYVGWPDTGALQRRLDDGKSSKDAKPGNMYRNLGGTEEERQKNLTLFKQWVGKDAWKRNRWKARGDVPAIAKEDLDGIKVAYQRAASRITDRTNANAQPHVRLGVWL